MSEPTRGNWRPGKDPGTVITDCPHEGEPCNCDSEFGYGGHLIAESIGSKADVLLIAAAKELLEACRVASVHILHNRDDPADRKRVARQLSAVLGKAKGI